MHGAAASIVGMDGSVPYTLRGTLEQVMSQRTADVAASLCVLQALKRRLEHVKPDVRNVRMCRALAVKSSTVDVAIADLASGKVLEECREKAAPFIERFKTLERKDRERRQVEATKAATAHTRYLPTAPLLPEDRDQHSHAHAQSQSHAQPQCQSQSAIGMLSTGSNGNGVSASVVGDVDGDDVTVVDDRRVSVSTSVGRVVPTRIGVSATSACNGTLEGMVLSGEVNHVSTITREARFAFGLEERPVDLMPFDMCPTCRVAMKYNAAMHQLVCPVQGCGQWKRFADMTASALPYGEEVEFCKYTYRPVTHLDETMKHIEGAEAFVVPLEDLERVMVVLRKRRVAPEDITLPMIREICDKQKDIKVENAVQYYSRLTGRAPRRMTAYMKEQMRIMFHTQEVPFRKYRADRINNLSFPYTLYKYCELLGYWEMLESLPLLRGPLNLSHHDAILKKVCEDVDWEFIPTIGVQATV
jgi:hypothetical protein